jgi:hypothetical protein
MSSPKPIEVRSIAGSCVRMKKLGYIVGRHMHLYGEHIELVSDPFADGDCVAVHAISVKDPTVRTIELRSQLSPAGTICLQKPQIRWTPLSPQRLRFLSLPGDSDL